MDLVIDREKWARGGHGGASSLMNGLGNMCCLGFGAIAVGLEEEEISGVGEFSDLDQETIPYLQELTFNPFCTISDEDEDDHDRLIRNTKFHDRAVDLNDYKTPGMHDTAGNPIIRRVNVKDEADRERQLTELFKDAGITLTFTGKQEHA